MTPPSAIPSRWYQPRQERARTPLFLLVLAGLSSLSCLAAPPLTPPLNQGNNAGASRARVPDAKKIPDMDGASHVPGFPATPATLTREYVQAFMHAELEAPDVERMLHAFKHPDMGLPVAMCLPRYYSPRLVDDTRKLARNRETSIQIGAIGGMISLMDADPATRKFVRDCLGAANAALRERAAEYLCWHGISGDYQILTETATAERDVYARASMVEAAAAIKRRAALFGAGEAAAIAPGGDLESTYHAMAAILAERPTEQTRQAVIARLRTAEPFEPFHSYPNHLEQVGRGREQLELLRRVFGYADPPTDTSGPPEGAETSVPIASTLIGPVRDYLDDKRKSYGLLMDQSPGNTFAGKYHVGDDAAWRGDQTTVVAIGNGIVRAVELGKKSWGCVVIVEHGDTTGRSFCSVYGHLGPLVCVRPGQTVSQGQKIGVVGTCQTYANGGYLAHLHFGIYRSAFLVPDHVGAQTQITDADGMTVTATVTVLHSTRVEVRLPDGTLRTIEREAGWLKGYLTPEMFKSPFHAWVDPQTFVKSAMKPPG